MLTAEHAARAKAVRELTLDDLDWPNQRIALASHNVPSDLDVIPGAFHGFDLVFPKAEISREFWRPQAQALKSAL